MKKLTPEESERLPIRGARNASEFYKAIISLHVGEILLIPKEGYTLSRAPGRICRTIMKRFPNVKYECGEVADTSGWKVIRVQ